MDFSFVEMTKGSFSDNEPWTMANTSLGHTEENLPYRLGHQQT